MLLKEAQVVDLKLFEKYVGKNILFVHNLHFGPLYGRLVKNGAEYILVKDIIEFDTPIKELAIQKYVNAIKRVVVHSAGMYHKKNISEVYHINLKSNEHSCAKAP